MNITFKDGKLYMLVSPQERVSYLPFIYGAKLDHTSGLWVVPVGALLPIMTVFPAVKPTDKPTKDLLLEADRILSIVRTQKNYIKHKDTVKDKSYPFLMSHQAVCNNIADIRNRYAFFLDTGTR